MTRQRAIVVTAAGGFLAAADLHIAALDMMDHHPSPDALLGLIDAVLALDSAKEADRAAWSMWRAHMCRVRHLASMRARRRRP